MKLLADENVDALIVSTLRLNFDVLFIVENGQGISDEEVINVAHKEERFIITGDKDFGELVIKSKKAHHGVLLYRLGGLTNEEKASLVCTIVEKHLHEMKNNFSVLSSKQLRIRKQK